MLSNFHKLKVDFPSQVDPIVELEDYHRCMQSLSSEVGKYYVVKTDTVLGFTLVKCESVDREMDCFMGKKFSQMKSKHPDCVIFKDGGVSDSFTTESLVVEISVSEEKNRVLVGKKEVDDIILLLSD